MLFVRSNTDQVALSHFTFFSITLLDLSFLSFYVSHETSTLPSSKQRYTRFYRFRFVDFPLVLRRMCFSDNVSNIALDHSTNLVLFHLPFSFILSVFNCLFIFLIVSYFRSPLDYKTRNLLLLFNYYILEFSSTTLRYVFCFFFFQHSIKPSIPVKGMSCASKRYTLCTVVCTKNQSERHVIVMSTWQIDRIEIAKVELGRPVAIKVTGSNARGSRRIAIVVQRRSYSIVVSNRRTNRFSKR